MKLHSREEFLKINENYSDEDLERLDSEIREYEFKLEDYLKKEFPSAEEDEIYKFIDNLSSAYVSSRKYDELKKLFSNFKKMGKDFASFSGINEGKFDKLFGVKPKYLFQYDNSYEDVQPKIFDLDQINDDNGLDTQDIKLITTLKDGESCEIDSGHVIVTAYLSGVDEEEVIKSIEDKQEKYHVIDLKNKKIIKSGLKKEIVEFKNNNERLNNGPRYIKVSTSELKKGNAYIKPNEYTLNEGKFEKLFGADKLSHRIREFVDKYAAISPNWNPEENIENGDDEIEGKYTGPDVYELLYVADQLDKNIKPTKCWSDWSSGCYKPFDSREGNAEHIKLMKEINDIINEK